MKEQSKRNWKKEGLIFGLFMYVFNVILFPLFSSTDEITTKKLLLGIPVWILGGLVYGLVMKFYYDRKQKK